MCCQVLAESRQHCLQDGRTYTYTYGHTVGQSDKLGTNQRHSEKTLYAAKVRCAWSVEEVYLKYRRKMVDHTDGFLVPAANRRERRRRSNAIRLVARGLRWITTITSPSQSPLAANIERFVVEIATIHACSVTHTGLRTLRTVRWWHGMFT